MKILVTGAAGFIGFHVSNALVREGHEVVGLDNFNDYYDPALKRARAARLAALPRYRGVEGDIVDGGRLAQLFAEHRFDRVCHLAAQAGVRYSVTHPHVYQKSNLEGFLHILEACRYARTPRLVYASRACV